jgi:putative DNA primase/helicase
VSAHSEFAPAAPLVDPAAIAIFAEVVFGYTEGLVPVRLLSEKDTASGAPWIETQAADRALAASLAASARRAETAGRALFAVPATIAQGTSARREDLAETAVIMVDLDTGPIAAKRDHLVSWLGAPTLEVASGGVTNEGEAKLHLYWRLTEAVRGADLDLVADLRESIAVLAGGDQSFARLTQPIRVAGSVHAKSGKRTPVSIIAHTGIDHDLHDLAERVGQMPPFADTGPSYEIDTGAVSGGMSAPNLFDRVIHQGGTDGITRFLAISKVAGHLIRRARQGRMTVADAWIALQEYNRDHIAPSWDLPRLERDFQSLVKRDRATNAQDWASAGERPAAGESGATVPPPAWSDDAIAQAVVEACGQDWRYVPAWGRWMHWRGTHWVHDETRLIRELIRQTCRDTANNHEHKTQAQRIASAKTVGAVERLIESDPAMARAAEAFDRDLMLFNCASGIIDLETGELRPHDRDAHMTRVSPARMGSGCPTWLAFLDEIMDGDAEMVAYLRRVCGYCLTGSTGEQVFFFLHGEGANGKSVFLEVVGHVLGDYAASANPDTFMTTRGERHSTELAGLRSARLVMAGEVEAGRSWAEGKVKLITGGETLRVHYMHRDEFEYRPTYKLVFSGNHRPSLDNVGEAMRRRIHLVPFPVTIPPERRDTQLANRLCSERDGILSWMLEGLADWQQQGLAAPEAVRLASDAYLADEDLFGQWIGETCEVAGDFSIPTRQAYGSWSEYAESLGIAPGSVKAFAEKLRARGFQPVRTSAARQWRGLRLRGGRVGE